MNRLLRSNKPNDTLKASLHLTNGRVFEITIGADRSFSPDDFTSKTIWRFPSKKSQIIVPGDRILRK
jgi:hypothetical protein